MKIEEENRKIEYKASKSKIPNDVWETYSAFANTEGGTIILGISEINSKKYEITGVKNAELRVEEFWKMVTNPQKVSKNILREDDVYIKNENGKDLIYIEVPEAVYNEKPVYINGHKELSYKRIGSEDKKLTEEEFKYMVINSLDDIDTLLLENFDLDDLNKKDIVIFRDFLIENTKDEKYLEMSLEDFLKEMGVLRKNRRKKSLDEKEYLLTLGGLLFFGKYNSIVEYYPNFQLDFFRKKTIFDTDWIDRISTGDKDFLEMNIFSFYLKVLEKLTQSIETKFNLNNNLSRDSYFNDVSRMLREVLTNTVIHAYYAGNKTVKIINYDDYWEFFNPGNMRVTKEEFIHGGISKIRNSVISILFRRIGYVERAGSGGPRIFDTAERYNLKTPEIITTETDTAIKIWKVEPMDFYNDRSDMEKLILKIILTNSYINKAIALEEGISEYEFKKYTKILINDEIISRIGKARNIKYVLKNSEEASILNLKKLLVNINTAITK